MPGTCVIGLQWGDEAKGKIVDLLTERARYRRPLPGRGATPGIPSSPAARPTSSRSFPAAFSARRCSASSPAAWCSTRPASCKRSTGWWPAASRSASNLMHQRSGPRHLSLAHRGRRDPRQELLQRREAIGTTHARHRPLLPRQGRPLARHPAGRPVSRPTSASEIEHIAAAKNQLLVGMLAQQADTPLDAAQDLRRIPELRRAAEAARGRHDHATCSTRSRAGKRVLFEGAKARCSTSTTAPFPSSPAATARAWASSSGSGVPGRYINKMIGVVKAYTHARRRRAVSDRAGQRHRPAHPRSRQRIRHGHAAAAALRLVRRRGGALYGPAERRRQRWP